MSSPWYVMVLDESSHTFDADTLQSRLEENIHPSGQMRAAPVAARGHLAGEGDQLL